MFCATAIARSCLPTCSRVRPEVRQRQPHGCFPRHTRSFSLLAPRLATHSPSQLVSLPRKRVGCSFRDFGGDFGADVAADDGGNHEVFHGEGHMLDHGQQHGGEDDNPGRDPGPHDQESRPLDTTRRDPEMGAMDTCSENTEGNSDTEQVKDEHISHAPFAGYEWPTIPWEALKLLSQAAVIVILKQCLGAQGLALAAGCVWASYSRAFHLAAYLVAFASLIKSCRLGSETVDLAAMPCALYTTISLWALLYGYFGAKGLEPHVTRVLSLPLIQGQAKLPLLAWNLAQNAGAVHLMTFATTWAPRVLAVAAYVAWMRICCPPAVELFDQLFGKPKSATTSGPASPPKDTAQSDEEVQRANAPKHGWLAVQLLMLGLALSCARSTVGVQGCAVAVLTGASTLPGTWTKGFLLVLTGSWLHKLWGKHRLGNLFSALHVLAIGLTIDHTAGFSASFLSGLPSLQLEHSTFQGILRVPALLAEAVSGAHAKAWYQVNWGSKLLFVVSSMFFANATEWLANADSTKKGAWLNMKGNANVQLGQKGPAAIPGAAVCAAHDLIAGCSSSLDEPLFAVVQVAAATAPGQKGWRLSEEVIHWRKWQEEEQHKIYRYWQLPASASNLGRHL